MTVYKYLIVAGTVSALLVPFSAPRSYKAQYCPMKTSNTQLTNQTLRLPPAINNEGTQLIVVGQRFSHHLLDEGRFFVFLWCDFLGFPPEEG